MKKIIVVVLAVLLAVSTMPMTAFAASEPADFDFAGFDVVENADGNGVVVDLENKIVYGFKTALKVSELGNFLTKGAEVDSMYVCENYGTDKKKVLGDDDYIGTGTYIVLKDKDVEYPFEFVIFGDVNGDSVCDALDAFYIAKVSNKVVNAPADVATNMAATSPETYENGINVEAYQVAVNNAILDETEEVDQNQGQNANTVESIVIDDQVYTGAPVTVDGDVEILFNGGALSDTHYEIVPDSYKRNIDQTTGKEKATVTLRGKGLFAGEIVVEFEIVGLLYDIVNEVNAVIEEAQLSDVVKAVYTNNADVDNIDIVVNASKAVRGDFDMNMAALNGLLAKIDEYRAEKLPGLNLVVDEFALASNGSFSRADVKNFVFDLVRGAFCEIAYAQSNTIKSYSGEISTTDVNAEKFNVNLVVEEDYAGDINRVKAFAAKIARYVSFDVVNGNSVINVKMPASFSAKVVDILSNGTGDKEAAAEAFNNLYVFEAFEDYLAKVSVDDISAGSANEIEQAIDVAAMFADVVNKGLGEVASATVTSNSQTMPLLSGMNFVIDETNPNKFGALVLAFACTLSEDFLKSSVGDFYKDGIYTLAADVELDYKGIKETVIINLDLFTALEETPDVIEETVVYFDSIINTLGVSNVASVSYDKDALRALATLNATELLDGNLKFNETALDGLYSDIKGYFDDNYGTSTIVVDGNEIVTAGKINKSAVKAYLFDMVGGFFADVAAMNGTSLIRSNAVKVTEADGTVHNFDLDFQLEGYGEDIAKLQSISGKVANYVSLDTTSGNAEVTVKLPEGMKNQVVDLLSNGTGDVEAAREALNNLDVHELVEQYVMKVDVADISASSAEEIQTAIDMVAGMDSLINKLMGKVSESSVAYDAKGNKYALLSGVDFVVADNTFASLVAAVACQFSEELLRSSVANFMNEDGSYTIVCDVALEVGGIKETVVLNFDLFGEIDKKTAVDNTVDYAKDIIADLGISNVASVTYEDGKAVAALNATEILNGELSFKEDAFDGLYTEIKGYFDANFSDSTIKVGDYEIVTAGTINKSALKSFVFDFATGFFNNVANMDAGMIASYATSVVDGEGNAEEFAFDFQLAGDPADVAKLQSISGKVASCVSLDTTSGNAVATVKLPEGMKNQVVDLLSNGTGDVEAAREALNNLDVHELVEQYVMKIDVADISVSSAEEIQTAIDMVAGMDSLINKLMGKISESSVAYDAKGNEYALLSGVDFVVADNTFASLVAAVACQFSEELLRSSVANFMNEDGSYTIVCDVALEIGGIKETVVLNFDLF